MARWKRKVRASREARLKLEAEQYANGMISNGVSPRPHFTSISGHYPYQNGVFKNGSVMNGFPNGCANGGVSPYDYNLQKRRFSLAARISGAANRPGKTWINFFERKSSRDSTWD